MQIAGSNAIVSGGASGLGAATVRRLAENGAYVFIADLNVAAGTALGASLPGTAEFAAVDISDEPAVEAVVQAAAARPGGLRVLVNCAGIATAERIIGKDGRHDLRRFAQVVQINLVGTFTMLQVAAEAMSRNDPDAGGERGVIINTASIAAFDGQIGQAAYAAAKAGIVGLTLPAARELARYGIRVVTIAPGIFDTPLLAGLPEAARRSLGEQVPFPARLGRSDEFAALAQHIIENSMLNGETIRLDGAIRMAPR